MLGPTTELSFEERLASCPMTMLIPPKIHLELQQRGTVNTCDNDVRAATRFRCNGPAVLEWVDSPYGISLTFPMTQAIIRNLSKTGFSVLADRQWFPEQTARLYLPIAIVQARVVRARRLGSRCYDIGLRIVNFRSLSDSSSRD
jgi:hypothetical protein